MALSVPDLIHRTIVFGAIGFGMAAEINQQLTPQVYGSVVIGQNYVVKKRRLEEYEAQQKALAAENPDVAAPAPTTQ